MYQIKSEVRPTETFSTAPIFVIWQIFVHEHPDSISATALTLPNNLTIDIFIATPLKTNLHCL